MFNTIGEIRRDFVASLTKQEPTWAVKIMIELLEAERPLAESHGLFERQLQIIEELGYEGCDVASAQIVFDTWLVSLSMRLQDRQRLRGMLNVKAVEAGNTQANRSS
jgi:hypothetical protein